MLIRLFVGLYLAGAAGLFANLLVAKAADGEEGGSSAAFVLTWVVMYALTVPLVGIRFNRSIHIRELIVLGFGVFAIAGYFWSALPAQTLRYSTSLCLNILFAWCCARKLSVAEFIRILQGTLNIMVAVGIVLGLAKVPSAMYYDQMARSSIIGLQPIQGLFSHKIYAGYYAAAALVMNVTILRGWLRPALSGLALMGVVLSGSSIGLASAAIGLAVAFTLPLIRGGDFRLIGSLLGFILLVVGVAFFPILFEGATTALGRDATLTGRTDIWEFAIQFWSEKPVAGWAYGGIFGSDPSAPGQIVRSNDYYTAPHFHNVYLQVAAEFGSIGLLLYLYFSLAALFGTLGNGWLSGQRAEYAAGAILIVGYVIGTGMNIGLRYNELSTVLMFFLFFAAPYARADIREEAILSNTIEGNKA